MVGLKGDIKRLQADFECMQHTLQKRESEVKELSTEKASLLEKVTKYEHKREEWKS